VFLDRDGTINEMVSSPEGPDSPRSVEEFRLLPGAARAVRRLNELGLPVVLVSNQPGMAKGKFSTGNLDAMTARMNEALRSELAVLDGIYYCFHHPDAVVAEYRKVCDCRKPKPGLLKRAASEMGLALVGSYMVGDQSRDIIAGKSVGCTTMLLETGGRAVAPGDADYVCRDLESAARLIVELEGARASDYAPEEVNGNLR
jgi:D-glycero-D-manno-heptose 1,7-bisphosphate phosphatase